MEQQPPKEVTVEQQPERLVLTPILEQVLKLEPMAPTQVLGQEPSLTRTMEKELKVASLALAQTLTQELVERCEASALAEALVSALARQPKPEMVRRPL